MQQPYERLERDLARWADVPPECMVVASSGTAALHLALEALQLQPGEVVCPDFTMIAVPRAISLAGHRPTLADCGHGAGDLNLHPEAVAEACWSWTRAILAVHTYGRRCAMDSLHAIAAVRHLPVVEDMAELHGVSPHPESAAAAWSFFSNKVVGGQEGGAVYLRDPARAALARQLRCLGFTEAHDYTHTPRGHNYRLSNAHAALISYSLGLFTSNWEARRRIEAWYDAACPDEWRQPIRESPWVYDVRLPGLTRDRQTALVRALREAGIAARHGFYPISMQMEYSEGCEAVGWGNAWRAASEVLYLPVLPGRTTAEDCARAFEVIKAALANQPASVPT